jgi:hypothetical protein
MNSSARLLFIVASLLALFSLSSGEDAAYDDQSYNNDNGTSSNDDNSNKNTDDNGMEDYGNNVQYSSTGDSITYWHEYAILPKRCIVQNNVDVIVFTIHPDGYKKQCQDQPLGTYTAPVPNFVGAYLNDIASTMADSGKEYTYPSVAEYLYCTPYVIENTQYYFQLGCADGNTLKLAVNIYKDNACSVRSTVDDMDDANIDVSEIQVRYDAVCKVASCGIGVDLCPPLHRSFRLRNAKPVLTGMTWTTASASTTNGTKITRQTLPFARQHGPSRRRATSSANARASYLHPVTGTLPTRYW